MADLFGDAPRVLNKHRDGIPPGAVYVGRGSPWGNPYKIGPGWDRAAANKPRQWLPVVAMQKVER